MIEAGSHYEAQQVCEGAVVAFEVMITASPIIGASMQDIFATLKPDAQDILP